MKYSIDKKDKYAVFQLQEENLNSLLAPKLKSELVIFANEGVRNLIFDLSQVQYVGEGDFSKSSMIIYFIRTRFFYLANKKYTAIT